LIVAKDTSTGIGLIGFKGYPNDKGETEIGYGINEDFRNLGYMTAAVKTLSEWAFSQPECNAVTATSVSNPASERVLRKLGRRLLSQGAGPTDWVLRKETQQ
jgi:RimJ/RimL family protein N-acetyltransferase